MHRSEWPLRVMRRDRGFTIAELLVAITIFGLMILGIISTLSTVQSTQRNERYLDLANTAARQIIEEARGGQYDALVAGQSYDRTSSISESLPGGSAQLSVSSSSSLPDFKRLDVDVSYTVGGLTRHVYSSAIIGKESIVQ